MSIKIALAGNPNCGKTTMFNDLTGSSQYVGNWPGVTVEKKEGRLKGHKDVSIVDLPGIYSLSPYTNEEIVTRDFLLNNHPDGIINIVDATNIERNLYLSMQLIELNLPMVIALNMMDEVRANGGTIIIEKFQEELGVPVVPISASKNEGIDELIETAVSTAGAKQLPKRQDFCSGAVHRAIHSVAHLVEDHAERIGVPPRFAATKLVEGDEPMLNALGLSENEKDMVGHSVTEMERELGTDREAALADMRYTFIDGLCRDSVVKTGESKEHRRSVAIDSVLTHKYFAIPIFLAIMMLVFYLTFGVIGSALSDLLSLAIDFITGAASAGLTAYGINPVVHSLLIDGVFAGVGSVLSFLPIIVVLFFFLSILEDSGYMARAAFIMDAPMRHIGLSGRAFVPLLMGFGCTVPAVMGTRILESEKDKRLTILITPFMSCSAKTPVYSLFIGAFFAGSRPLVMFLIYAFGIVIGLLSALLFKNSILKGKPAPFVMELPDYRLPTIKTVWLHVRRRIGDFLQKAGTSVFIATVAVWLLQSFTVRLQMTDDSSNSIIAAVGRAIAPVFTLCGFGTWKPTVALLTGLVAKESVISTMSVLYSGNLTDALRANFTALSACSYLIFVLLYTPCIAALSAVRREMGSLKWTAVTAVYQLLAAWYFSAMFYQCALFIQNLLCK